MCGSLAILGEAACGYAKRCRSPTKNRQAGTGVEITPEMIDAGVEVLLREIGLARAEGVSPTTLSV